MLSKFLNKYKLLLCCIIYFLFKFKNFYKYYKFFVYDFLSSKISEKYNKKLRYFAKYVELTLRINKND